MSKASPAFLAELRAEAALYEKLFGRLVNQVRNEQGLSQEDFGGTVGVSRTEMHHVEGGQTDMKLSTFLFMCRAMRRGFGEVASHLEHQVEHPEHRAPEKPLKNQRGKNTRRSSH
jgi:DNA-binding XRE family transcriptional regulator